MDTPEQAGGADLQGRRIAVPESRDLALLTALLQRRGAQVYPVPLVAIHDHPDQAAVAAWIERLIGQRMELLVLYTGEGVRRLVAAAQRLDRKAALVAAFSGVRKLTRGPKPERALRELGLRTDLRAVAPTTQGVIATLERLPLADCRVAIQTYGDRLPEALDEYLRGSGAQVDVVAPYRYADASEQQAVEALLDALFGARVDGMVFTAGEQVARLYRVARAHGAEEELTAALGSMPVVAVGPLVADGLARRGVTGVAVPSRFALKPLVTVLADRFARGRGDGD